MKNCLVLLLVLLSSLVSVAEELKPIVDFDFTKGCPPDCVVRGDSAFVDGGLTATNRPPKIYRETPSGICLKAPRTANPRAFTVEMEFVPTPQHYWNPHIFMALDESYGSKKGFSVRIYRSNNSWKPEFIMGFGTNTLEVSGPNVVCNAESKLCDGVPALLRITYDGQGNLDWHFAGREMTMKIAATGPLAPPVYPLCIGDRVGSTFMPFDGIIRRVRIIPEEYAPISVRTTTPTAFIRGEADSELGLEFSAEDGKTLEGVRVAVEERSENGYKSNVQAKYVGRLAPGKPLSVRVPVETRLKPGKLTFAATITYTMPGLQSGRKTFTFDGLIGPRPDEGMPVIAWNGGRPIEFAKQLGFRYFAGGGEIYWGSISSPQQPKQIWNELDDAVAQGVRYYIPVGPMFSPDLPRKDQLCKTFDGKMPKDYAIDMAHPAVQENARRTADLAAQKLALHPGLGGLLLCSEDRGASFPSFNANLANYTKETGLLPPPSATNLQDYVYLKKESARFPTGIVPDDYPRLKFWRWFRSTGDSYPAYISRFSDAFAKVHGRYEDGSETQKKRPFFTWFDPAVRWAPLWGQGGSVDILSQWVYAAPEAMAVAGPCEELFAMAAGRPGQQVMIMTQLMVYRSEIAPKTVKVENEPQWAKDCPDGKYPSLPPDILQEATWTMIAKPVRGIMYHGWGALYGNGKSYYCHTHPMEHLALSNVLNNVVRPLGATLLKVGRRPGRVAFLESCTTGLLGGGYGDGWENSWLTLINRARLDPRVIYEEGVLRDGLDDVKVLFVTDTPLMSAALVEKIKAFQKRGGILVGDSKLCKALTADVPAPTLVYRPPLDDDHAEAAEARDRLLNKDSSPRHKKTVGWYRTSQMRADEIRAALAKKGFQPLVDSSSTDIITYMRNWKSVPYVFAINDKRSFGDYCGAYGALLEKGEPTEGTVTVVDPKKRTQAVYELSRGEAVAFSHQDGKVVVPVKYTTNDGRLFVFLPEKIADLRVETSGKIVRGGTLKVRATVLGASGKPIQAVLPVEIVVTDAQGRVMDGCGWRAAEGGVVELEMPLNLDEPVEGLKVTVRDRASGLVRTTEIR